MPDDTVKTPNPRRKAPRKAPVKGRPRPPSSPSKAPPSDPWRTLRDDAVDIRERVAMLTAYMDLLERAAYRIIDPIAGEDDDKEKVLTHFKAQLQAALDSVDRMRPVTRSFAHRIDSLYKLRRFPA